MKIRAITIEQLFDTFNYHIDFSKAPNPLIITGLNGYGKTTILTILDRLAHNDLFYFYILPFLSIKVDFDNKSSILINSKYQDKRSDDEILDDENTDSVLTKSRMISFKWLIEDSLKSSVIINERNIRNAVRQLGFYRRTYLKEFVSFQSDEFYEFVKNNQYFYSFFKEQDHSKLLFMMLDSFNATFVEAQRIIIKDIYEDDNEDSHFYSCIDYISDKLRDILKNERFNYLSISQRYDSSLIDTLLKKTIDFEERDYNKVKNEVEAKLKNLEAFNLVENIKIKPYDSENKHVLTVYLKNLQQKISSFDKILPKLQLFRKLVEELKLVNKDVAYDPNKGIIVQSKDGKFLNLEHLSSGEKNEIIMLYYMIFEVSDNTVLLLDEPEISLHIAWQNSFIYNLTQISKQKNLQVIVATHSPQIIGDKWEDCYDLCENARYE